MILFYVSLIAIAMLGRLLSCSESHLQLPFDAASLSVSHSSLVASATGHSLRV